MSKQQGMKDGTFIRQNIRKFIPLFVIFVLLLGGYLIDRYRAARLSQLSGFFESQPTLIASRVTGRVQALPVLEGDFVKKGQVLVILEAKPVDWNLKAAEAIAEQAEEKKKEVLKGPREEDIQRQEEVVAELRSVLQKLINGPWPEEIRIARERAVQARARLRIAVEGSRPEEIRIAKAAEREAKARLDQAIRGLTREERLELKARLEAARSKENLANLDYERARRLFDLGAISKSSLDNARTAYETAKAAREDAEQAYLRGELGTPPEELRQAQQAHAQAKAHLDLALAGSRPEEIESARAELKAAELNLAILLKGSRKEDIEAARARLRQAEVALLELKRGSRIEEKAQSIASAKAADYQAKSLKKQFEEHVVVAPIDGVVQKVKIAVGDLIQGGVPIIEIANPEDIWVRVYLPESELSKVSVGSSAFLAVDGIDQEIEGFVESINTTGEFTPANLQSPEERGKQVFGIRIRLKKPDPRVKSGMFVTVKRVGKWP
jgi:multidrug resistance efflux pump